MNFNIDNVTTTEFGVVCGPLRGGDSARVPVDVSVQTFLHDMVRDTTRSLDDATTGTALENYEPSEEHSAGSKAVLPIDDALAEVIRGFYLVGHRPITVRALDEPKEISAYFCVLHDTQRNKLIGIRRAAQFKAVLESRLIWFSRDTFRAVEDAVFKLDHDFDLLIDGAMVYINRVSAFEFLAEVDAQVKAAAVENVKELERLLPFIEFEGLSEYVQGHKRGARVAAALRGRDDLAETSLTNLKRECHRAGVGVRMDGGRLFPEQGHELEFLQMLDRRRYAVSLVKGKHEHYEAASRKKTGERVRREVARQGPPAIRAQNARG
jgi:hypothetical protein